MTAYYNKPDDERDTVAHFHSAQEANDYAAKYGGSVDAAGVVFTVGHGADHAKAKDDVRSEAKGRALSEAKALIAQNESPKALSLDEARAIVAAAESKADKAAAKAAADAKKGDA